MMIMSRHVQDDLDSFSDDDCFLNTSVAFQPATNSDAKLEGKYLYHNEKKGFGFDLALSAQEAVAAQPEV